MSNHQYIPPVASLVAPAESPVQGILIAVACVAVFAFIGVLLAWRG